MKQEKIDTPKIIGKGVTVSPGRISGPVRIVKKSADAANVQPGDIMVVSHSNPAFAVGVMTAAALICQRGGTLTHICIVAREMGIPCIVQMENAMDDLKDNTIITLDATNGTVTINE